MVLISKTQLVEWIGHPHHKDCDVSKDATGMSPTQIYPLGPFYGPFYLLEVLRIALSKEGLRFPGLLSPAR